MRSRARALPALLATFFVAALLVTAPAPAHAGDKLTGRIDIEARLEPAGLEPGETGTLIVEATLLPKLHIYATGEQAMVYKTLDAEGVTYGKPELSKHHVWKDELGEAFDVWEGTFTAKVKVTLAEDVAPGTKVGMAFTYYGCNDRGCYAPVEDHEAFVKVGGASEPAGPEITNPAPTDGGGVRLLVNEEGGMVAVIFEPAMGYHFYGPGSTKGLPVEVVPQASEGVTWGKPVYPPVVGEDIHGPYTVTVKYERKDGANELKLLAKYAACTDTNCLPPEEGELKATWAPAGGAAAGGGPAAKGAPPVNPNVVADAGPTTKNAPLEQGASVEIKVSEERGLVAVIFTPDEGHHLYGPQHPDKYAKKVEVVPVESEGIKWGSFKYPDAEKIKERYTVVIPFERAEGANELAVIARYLACDAAGCKDPHEARLSVTWGGAAPTGADPAPAPPEEPAGEVLFPVVDDDDLGAAATAKASDLLSGNLFVGFGVIFLIGLGLAFTPCVLPIIPITVSVITGGNPDIPKKRLTGLLVTYVAGLSLTFATLGVIAALAGGTMSAAFESAAVQWGIAILFFVLGFMMLGIYELQPPQWLMKLQGGAQKRSGSFVGAFLFGCLGAIIASPCTGPAIAGLLIATAKSGNTVLGFFSFLTLGLGMGTVFFAAGSLNFILRPGPWMEWVRYSFGGIMIGAALYYLRSGGHITPDTLYILGFSVAVLAWIGIAWHHQKKLGEAARPARIRGAQVAVMVLAFVGLVAFLTRPATNLLDWIKVKDTEHLVALVDEAKAESKPVVVDFWATWCHYCKEYDKLIAGDPELREKFEQVVRIKVDVTEDQRKGIRAAVGMPVGQPRMVIFDKQGRIRRNADVIDWYGYEKGPEELEKRLDLVLNDTPVKTASQPK